MSNEVTLFKHRAPFMNIVMPNGYKIAFTKGEDGHGHFWTKDSELESKLKVFIKGEPGLGVYVDKNEPVIDPQFSSPVEKIKQQAIKEYIEQQSKRIDAGTSDQGQLRVQNADQLATLKATLDPQKPGDSDVQPKVVQVPMAAQDSNVPPVVSKSLADMLKNKK